MFNKELDLDILRIIPQIYYKGRAPHAINSKQWECLSFSDIGKTARRLVKKFIENDIPRDFDFQHLFSSQILDPKYKFYSFKDNDRCCSYQKGIFITNDGSLTLCPNANEPIDNIRDNNYKKIIKNRINLTKNKKSRIYNIKGADKYFCINCRYKKICGFGCPAIAEKLTGDIKNPDPIKCSFSILWEKEILPILPNNLQEEYKKYLINNAKKPKYFSNIKQIINYYN